MPILFPRLPRLRASDPLGLKQKSRKSLSTRSLSCLSASIRDDFVFDDLEMKRGTSLVHALRGCGTIWKNSTGSESTFSLSKKVDRLDGFVSHNWSTPRCQKFLALAIHFNLVIATVVTLTAIAIIATLTGLGILPKFRSGLVCSLLGVPLFFLVLVFLRDMLRCADYCSGSYVFIDKICIHQTDEEQRRKGIERLGAFLYSSDKLFIVYTGSYLNKLWTVYELGSFLLLRSSKKVVVVLPVTSRFICILTPCVYLADLFYAALPEPFTSLSTWIFQGISNALQVLAISMTLRYWARCRKDALADARNFRVSNAECALEADRPLIIGMIVRLMQNLNFVEEATTPEDALVAFEHLVQSVVPTFLTDSFGSTGLPYSQVLVAYQTVVWNMFGRVSDLYRDDESFQVMCALVLYHAAYYFVLVPTMCRLADFISTRKLDEFGWTQVGVHAVVLIVCVPLLIGSDFAVWRLQELAGTSALALGIMVATLAVLGSFVIFLYRPCHMSENPPTSSSSDSGDKVLESASI